MNSEAILWWVATSGAFFSIKMEMCLLTEKRGEESDLQHTLDVDDL